MLNTSNLATASIATDDEIALRRAEDVFRHDETREKTVETARAIHSSGPSVDSVPARQ